MERTITEHMEPGERALVICKKVLIDQQRVPNWSDGDERFQDQAGFTTGYAWDIGGRKLGVVHWGTGIGSNEWKDANVVFLFDELFIPRRTAAANVQGLREHRVHEGDLAAMTTPTSSRSISATHWCFSMPFGSRSATRASCATRRRGWHPKQAADLFKHELLSPKRIPFSLRR
jgi:hypothetical protein